MVKKKAKCEHLFVCACVCSSYSVAQKDTDVVLSFALLPVSLFPVYLAVICFTKVWLCEMICVFLHLITDILKQQTCYPPLYPYEICHTALKRTNSEVESLNERCRLILSDLCWLFSGSINKNAWYKGKLFKFWYGILVNAASCTKGSHYTAVVALGML